MKLLGKLVGAGLGLVVGGPAGLVAGAALGHAVDAGVLRWRPERGLWGSARELQVETLYSLLGWLAKVDGRVSEAEVAWAEKLMARMQLSARERSTAIKSFNRGRQGDLDLAQLLAHHRLSVHPQRDALQALLQALVDFARSDGPLTDAERDGLERITIAAGLKPAELSAFLQACKEPLATRREALAELGLSEGADAREIALAYRRLASQLHPDKLSAQGVDADQIKVAQERLLKVRKAYERLSESTSN